MISRSIDWPRNPALLARFFSANESWFWLDGEASEVGLQTGRSFIGSGNRVVHATIGAEHDFFDTLRSALDSDKDTEIPTWIVALSYEFGSSLLGVEPHPDDVSAGFAIQVETVVVLDHVLKRSTVYSVDDFTLSSWVNEYQNFIDHTAADEFDWPLQPGSDSPAKAAVLATPEEACTSDATYTWRDSPSQYQQHVDACRKAIREGEAYVLCLTDVAQQFVDHTDELALYLQLRGSQPEIRGAVIATSDRTLVSASPERFLTVRNSLLSTTPMKGTRPRSSVPSKDDALARELAHDQKEIAENLMIVDLMRNDFSKICSPETIRTERFLEVETHQRVHQLVSTVTGILNEEYDIFDALDACFPGGSMTGAPKKRAVELLAALEQAPRGLYSGCFGWIGSKKDAELAMTIRSVELRDLADGRQLARVGAGGGITIDSDATSEFEEKEFKARQLLNALTQL